MSNEIREAWINMCLRDEQLADFMAVKQYLGLQNNTDVIRLLIRKEAHAIRRAQALRPPSSPQREQTPSWGRTRSLGQKPANVPPLPGPPGALPDAPPGALEPHDALCLACPLPDCDDADPRCPYQQATGELDHHRAQQRADVQRRRATRRRRAAQARDEMPDPRP